MAGYSGTPLPKKLGVSAGHRVLLDGAPAGFELRELPADVTLHRRSTASLYDVIVVFCPDLARLRRRWAPLHRLTPPAGALWVAWPKRASGLTTDLDENVVRAFALANGRVDVKVCAIDQTWSGLKHVVRLADR
ncbi:DUF3052 domain-containing protein [Dactylosporangium salmoneum]|uniref:DUF3052 domain-containing protein n=1 Tax=Dactylosporangium salmoneum TaxID=53361 RepID=UPI0031D8BCC7